ncbi:DKNYY domain-containing protein [Candidatus Peregrinibacteria bacterium]|nr:DKNYY domain-containing protein [Candidatus Peregrinibacteria bacterium]
MKIVKNPFITILCFVAGFLLVSCAMQSPLKNSKYPKHKTEETEPEKPVESSSVFYEEKEEQQPEEEKPAEQPDDPENTIPYQPDQEEWPASLGVEERIAKLNIRHTKTLELFNSTRFKTEGGKVTYAEYEVKGADLKSFTPLTSDYAKDKNAVYFRNAVIKNADPATFEVIGFNYGKDAENIFYENYEINMESQDNDVKPDYESFEVLGEDYARDKDNLYCWGEIQRKEAGSVGVFFDNAPKGKVEEGNRSWAVPCDFTNHHLKTNEYAEYDEVKIKGVNVNTFVRLGNLYAADRSRIYCDFYELRGADYASFHSPIMEDNRFQPQRYAIDKNHAYYFCHPLEDVDLNTFEIMPSRNPGDPEYSKDKNNVYFREFKMPDVDLTTFEILEGDYAKDRNKVYYRENVLVGADLETFTSEHGTAKDKYSRFQQGARKEGENPEVEDLGGGYKKYKGELYFNNRKIEGVDLDSFYYVEDDRWMAFDKNHFYYGGLPVEGIDKETMEHIEYGFFTDKDHVFYITWGEVNIVEKADPETFQVINYHESRDKDHCYYDGIMIEDNTAEDKPPVTWF